MEASIVASTLEQLQVDRVKCRITKVCQFELSFLIDEQVLGFEVSV